MQSIDFFNVEGNTPTFPSLPVPPEQFLAINCSAPIMQFTPPSFRDSGHMTAFQLLLVVNCAECIGIEAFQFDCQLSHLFGRTFLESWGMFITPLVDALIHPAACEHTSVPALKPIPQAHSFKA